jgi:serine/threonine protein kinase
MGLAAAHNIDKEGQATMAHTDISPGQWIMVDGKFKLNDFNRARFLLKRKDNETQNCPFHVKKNPGRNRSPEEYRYDPETEKVDVYSFGNIIYCLVMKKLPWDGLNAKFIEGLIMEGKRPYLDPKFRKETADPIVKALVHAMEMCFEQDPVQRASARQVEQFLKAKLEEFDPGRLREWGEKL